MFDMWELQQKNDSLIYIYIYIYIYKYIYILIKMEVFAHSSNQVTT